MKRLLSIFCIAALAAGCATRPNQGPGSGSGADYVPAVQAPANDPAAYENDLARCRASAASIPFRASQHDDALVAKVSNLACDGEGMMGNMAAGMIQGALRAQEGRKFSLTSFSLGGLALKDVKISTANGLSITAEVGKK